MRRIAVIRPELEVLRAVRDASKANPELNGWVNTYDISLLCPRWTTAYLGLSMLPPMSRMGVLETMRKTGCSKFYQLSKLGKSALRRKPNKEGAVIFYVDE